MRFLERLTPGSKPRADDARGPMARAVRRTGRVLAPMRRPGRWILVAIGIVLLALVAIDVFADAPLRRHIEGEMNERLTGYTVSLAAVDFKPWNLSLEMERLQIVQDQAPEPPVAIFPRTRFSVAWLQLLRGRIVADAMLTDPALYVDLEKLREERDDDVDLDDRGWQDALLAAYPLEVNELEVVGGSLTYVHDPQAEPLELTQIDLLALNIRNIVSPDREYPSPVRAVARVFDEGRLVISGDADFLAKPHAGIDARLELEGVPLERLDPLSRDARFVIGDGTLSADGRLEYSPSTRRLHLDRLGIDGLRVDYEFHPEVTPADLETAKAIEDDPLIDYWIEELRVTDGEIGFVNRSADPGYRLFMSAVDLTATRFGTHSEGVSEAHLEGQFMGSGDTVARAHFRPDDDGADFDLAVAIQGTELTSMNDLLSSYANLDVADGRFSVYSEVQVADGRIDGYLKPLFEDIDVFEKRQDEQDGFFRKMWERIAGGLSKLLENRPRDEVATIAALSGEVDDPDSSNWQIVINLIKNAFFDAILPGFEERRS